MFKRVLTVCVGNICRSPTAEYLFRHLLEQRRLALAVESAGLGALSGRPMDETAAQILREHGLDATEHRARQVSAATLRRADLVLVMEKSQLATLVAMAPEASGKVFLLDKWGAAQDIPDPYRQQRPAFEHVYGLIDQAVRGWIPYLA